MLHKLFTLATLGILTTTGLVASGCATSNTSDKPAYGLTGTSSQDPSRDPRYQDSKGHYRSEWAVASGGGNGLKQ